LLCTLRITQTFVRKTVANVVVVDALVRFVVFLSPGLWYNPVRGTLQQPVRTMQGEC